MFPLRMSNGSITGFDSDRNYNSVEPKVSAREERVCAEEKNLNLSSKKLMSSDSECEEVPRVSMHDEKAARVPDGDGDGSSDVELLSSDDFKKKSSKKAVHDRFYQEKGQAGFDLDRNCHIVEPKVSAQQGRVSGEEKKLSLSSKNLMLSDSEGKEVSRVSMHDEIAARVSDGDGDGDGGSDVELVSSGEIRKTSMKNAEHGRFYLEKGQAGRVSGDKKKENYKKAVVSNAENDSMLSTIDDYAENEKSPRVGHGYEVGDMVWGKVKSHPWWPGLIFNEAFATSSVRKSKTVGQVLVAFFGDSSYGWFEPAELIPFELNFAEKSRQTTSRTFVKAVEDAVDELNKRRSLGFACRCRNPYSFRPTKVESYLAVDFSDSDSGVFSVSQIRKARDNFVPGGMLKFLKELALKPMNCDHRSIHLIQEKAAYLAYRKAVYEEFDETYAQAFGAHPQRPDPATAPLEPSKAPLSGRLVFAEALGKVKSPKKHSKPKDRSEKDKYVLKRRDDPLDPKTVERSHGKSGISSKPSDTIGSDPDVALPANQATSPDVSDVLEPSQNLPVAADQFHEDEIVHDNLSEKHHHSEGSDKKLNDTTTNMKTGSELKMVKARKRVLGDVDSKGFVAKEKTKKRKKDLVKETKLDPTDIPSTADGDNATLIHEKIPAPQEYPVREDLQVNNQENNLARHPMLSELPELLDELRDLALDPLYGAEKNTYPTVWQAFMKFRSLVYLKSPYIEPKEARPSVSSHLSNSYDNSNIPEKYKVMPSIKRAPSDRLEEMSVKKKKKIHDVKSLAAEKRATLKNPESDVRRADLKEVAQKPTSTRVPGSEPVKKKVVAVAVPPPAKAAGQMMMLVMKFPAEAALPSGAELRAKFARFGPMDYKATRIFYSTLTCRVVYYRKNDAEAALNFARSNFGSMNVRCYLREKETEADDPRRTPAASGQLKSCLKKPPSNEDGGGGSGSGNGNGNGNGNGGSVSRARVKFVLDGEDEPATANSHGLNYNRDKFQMVVPPPPSSSSQFPFVQPSNIPQKTEIQPPLPINVHNQPAVARGGGGPQLPPPPPPPPPNIDIREQMLSLLSRCEGIIKTLESAIGYVPFYL